MQVEVAPVSYTHLDVYKRQVFENQNNLMSETFRNVRTNLQFMLGNGKKVILVTSTVSGAVSYTHLDVYKRQVYEGQCDCGWS